MISESFKTTPESAITPIRLTRDKSYPSSICPITAPTTPKGIAPITISGYIAAKRNCQQCIYHEHGYNKSTPKCAGRFPHIRLTSLKRPCDTGKVVSKLRQHVSLH